MTAPVISSVVFDKPSYNPGDLITCTVNYSIPNTHMTGAVSYTVTGTVVDQTTKESGSLTGTLNLGGTAVHNLGLAALTGGEAGMAWHKVSDNQTSAAVFTSTAT
jgi:hypothetical protein